MTIPEASQLILQACALGRGGEIFIDLKSCRRWLLGEVERLYGAARDYDVSGIRDAMVALVPVTAVES